MFRSAGSRIFYHGLPRAMFALRSLRQTLTILREAEPVRWQSWIRDGWLGEQLGLRPRRRPRADGLVRGWRVRRLEERRVLSVTAVDAGANVGPVDEGSQVDVNATFVDDDPLNNDPYTATIDWGDGTAATAGTIVDPTATEDGEVTGSHFYADDGVYTVTVTVTGNDNTFQSDTFTVTVVNASPTLTVVADRSANEGATVAITDIGTFSDPGFNNPSNPLPGGETAETFTFTIDWGDGSTDSAGAATVDTTGSGGSPTLGSFNGSHVYADNGVYTVTVTVFDDDGGSDSATFVITVNNVAPTLTVVGNQSTNEGTAVSITNIGTFTDPGYNNPSNPIPGGETAETFTFTIDWGDGTTDSAGSGTIDTAGSAGVLTAGSFDGSHTYADNGVYTVTVTVFDDDTGSHQLTFTITVSNVAPTLVVVGNQNTNEGTQLSITNIGTFTDPGYNNPSNPIPGGETAESFTFTIDWGDGTTDSAGAGTIDTAGSAGVLTAGSFDGSHTYADNGVYTVTVTVFDDDTGSHQLTFSVTVNNVAPTLTVVGNQNANEGATLSITDIGTFTDPGFNNPSNPVPGGETAESFTFTIDWGDGTAGSAGAGTIDTAGSAGTPTAGSFNGSHVYADNGVYTVTVTVLDDDGGSHQLTFSVTVGNVAPTLTVVTNQTRDEGETFSITNIGTFTDPGFDNPSNPIPGGETTESFTFTIDWGDGTAGSAGAGTIDIAGSGGVLTAGSFDGGHTYADDGIYTVTVTVFDDDSGMQQRTFTITVNNVSPTLTVVPDQNSSENSPLNIIDIGTFTDPGYDNPSNPLPGGETEETFTFTIDWGDGTPDTVGSATIDTAGSAGVLTAGSFDGSHTYDSGGNFTVTVTVFDDDTGFQFRTFQVNVASVPPVLVVVGNQNSNEGAPLNLNPIGTFTNPDAGATHTATIDWGDGSSTAGVIVEGGGAGSIAASHTYADDGIYTVTVTVFDDDLDSDSETFSVTVFNVAPTINTNPGSGDEGEAIAVTFTDPGYDSPSNPPPKGPTLEFFSYAIDWGDGSPIEFGVATVTPGSAGVPTFGSISHVYADNGVYFVTLTVVDDNGGVDNQVIQITVFNVAPTVGTGANQTSNEGAIANVPGLAMFDAGTLDTHSAIIDWGDGSADFGFVAEAPYGPPGSIAGLNGTVFGGHFYADDGVYTVTVTVFDDDGGVGVSVFQVTVQNVAPTFLPTANFVVDEGQFLDLPFLALFTDPGYDNPFNPLQPGGSRETFQFTINWGDGSPPTALTLAAIQAFGGPGNVLTVGSILGQHAFADNGEFTVTITVFDDDGGMAQTSIEFVVNNVAPIITNLIPEDIGPESIGNLFGAFADPGADTWTITIVWGDDEPNTVFVIASGQIQAFQQSHQYFGPPNPNDPAAPIPISITIDDGDGGVAFQETVFNVPGTGLVGAFGLPAPAAPSLIGLAQATRTESAPQSRTADASAAQATSDNAAGGDTAGEEDVREIVLRIIKPDGEYVRDARTGRVKELLLTEAQLKDLRAFFRIWPDGHYRIDLREGKAERLIIEVYVRQGELVDPADIEELNAPANESQPTPDEPAAPVDAPTNESSAQFNRVWESWQPRRRSPQPIQHPFDAETAETSKLIAAGLTSEAMRQTISRIDSVSETKRVWHRRRLRRTAEKSSAPRSLRPTGQSSD